MITLENGNVQGLSGLAVPNGSMSLQLNVDATVIATPGFVAAGIETFFQFDSSGDLVQPCQIWSNAELNPQNSNGLGTYYLVSFFDANGARINKVPMWWQFPEVAGSTVDISTVTAFASVGGNVIYYPTSFLIPPPTPTALGGVFSNVGVEHQFATGIATNGALQLAQPSFDDISGTLAADQLPSGLTFGATTFSGLVTAQEGIQIGVAGTTSGQITLEGSTSGAATITAPAVAGTATNPLAFSNSLNIPAGTVYTINADTGLSRTAAATVAVGNGTAGDASGTVNAATYQVGGTQIAAANLLNGVTGTGAVVLAASPTLTGTALGANLTLSGILIALKLTVNAAGGPTITSGAGAPSGSQPNGSLYINTSGAHGTTTLLYIYNTATTAWVGIA